MRKSAGVFLLAASLLLSAAVQSHAGGGHGGHGGFHGGHGGFGGYGFGHGFGGHVVIEPFWWGPPYAYPYPYPYYPYWYPPPYYGYPTAMVVQEPSVYIQQRPAPPAVPQPTYWYYCGSAGRYYPDVQHCREAWIKVPPTPD